MSKDGRIGIRLDPKLLKRVKAYVRRRETTLTAIVEAHLRELVEADDRACGMKETADAEQI